MAVLNINFYDTSRKFAKTETLWQNWIILKRVDAIALQTLLNIIIFSSFIICFDIIFEARDTIRVCSNCNQQFVVCRRRGI